MRTFVKEGIKKMKYILYNLHAGHGTEEEKLAAVKAAYPDGCTLVNMAEIESYHSFFDGLDEGDIIVICGGDGTLNRFINDTAELDIKNEIFYLAVGTGNDFLKDIDGKPGEEICLSKYIKNLPTAEVNGKTYRFLNNVGFGIDGYCCEVGDAMKAEGATDICYTSIAIKGLLFHFKPKNATVTVDGVKHEYKKVWIAPTMNGRYYGGGMMPTPEQNRLSEDGELSLMVWHGAGKIKTLLAFPSLFKGEHLKHKKMVDLLSGHEITVEFDAPCALQIDGETVTGVTKYTARSWKK